VNYSPQISIKLGVEVVRPTIDSIQFLANDNAERQERVRGELVKDLGGLLASAQATQMRLAATGEENECLVLQLRKGGYQCRVAFTHPRSCTLKANHGYLYLKHIVPRQTDGKATMHTMHDDITACPQWRWCSHWAAQARSLILRGMKSK